MVQIGIYQITSPTGRVYIGQSSDIDRRFKTYFKLKRNRIGTGIYNSLIKHGVDKHRFSILCILPTSANKYHLNEMEVLYISAAKKAGCRMLNMTNGGSGSYGFKHSEETKKRLTELGTDINSGMAKPVLQYDLSGNLIKEWNAIATASKYYGVSPTSISQNLRGITYKSAGFIWKYKNNKNDNTTN